MTVYEQAVSKIRQLPEPLAQMVNDFIDSLLTRQEGSHDDLSSHLSEAQLLAESDIGDYAQELANYEIRLARGEIRW